MELTPSDRIQHEIIELMRYYDLDDEEMLDTLTDIIEKSVKAYAEEQYSCREQQLIFVNTYYANLGSDACVSLMSTNKSQIMEPCNDNQ